MGGAGLVITEMTDVSREGRISPGCAGMYAPEHVVAWKRIVDFVHAHSRAKIGMQLGHAGRKASTRRDVGGQRPPARRRDNWPILAPSPLPYFPHSQVPTRDGPRRHGARARRIRASQRRWRDAAGFDMLELHCAHGYLLVELPLAAHEPVAPTTYGGSLENRMRFPLEVFDAVRAAWPSEKPMSVRISATDWVPRWHSPASDAVVVARR